MSAKTLLNELTRLDVTVHVDGDKLLFMDPGHALTPTLKGALRTNRVALLAELAKRQSVRIEAERPAVEIIRAPEDKGARLVIRENGRAVGIDLVPFELAELAERLLDAGGRKALAKRQGIL